MIEYRWMDLGLEFDSGGGAARPADAGTERLELGEAGDDRVADFAGFETLLPNAWPPAHSSASWVTSSERAVIELGPLDES